MTSRPAKRGAFIVFEGLDRSGKTTQVANLFERLVKDGQRVKLLRFPDRTTPIGQMINSYLSSQTDLDDHVIHLLFSANRWELAKQIEQDLADGYSIICDRYIYSGQVYSAAKYNPSLSFTWARDPDVGLPRPDIVFFLEISPKEQARRGGFGEERYEQKEMQNRVRGLFKTLYENGKEEREDWILVNAEMEVENLQRSMYEAWRERMAELEAENRFGDEVRHVGRWEGGNEIVVSRSSDMWD